MNAPESWLDQPLDADQAKALLPAEDRIHTFTKCGAWMGCDVDRAEILAAIDANHGARLSEVAAMFDHHLLVTMDGAPVYVDTCQEALLAYRARQADAAGATGEVASGPAPATPQAPSP